MTEIQITIEGLEADKAAEDLLDISGIKGQWNSENETYRDGGILVTIATIVGISGGAVALAEQIRQWYLEYKKSQSDKGKGINVVIVTTNGRIVLENATIEQISQALKLLKE